MIREWKALVQFNMCYFTYHQWLLAIAVFVISNLVTLLYYGDLVSSTIDAFIFHFAVFEGADILTIIHTLLPFFVLAYIVDLYMENNFHENLLYTLLRISNRNAWALSHLTVLFAIHVVYLFFYYSLSWFILHSIYKSGDITVQYWAGKLSSKDVYSQWLFLFLSWIIQLIGSFSISLWQVYINLLTQKSGYGYFSAALMYIIPFIFGNVNLWIGSHGRLVNYDVLAPGSGSHSIAGFVFFHVLWILLFIYLSYRVMTRR